MGLLRRLLSSRRLDSRRLVLPVLAILVGLGACADDSATDTAAPEGSATTAAGELGEVPKVVDVAVSPNDDGTFRFDVTISSPYDRPDKYADAWRVVGPDGTLYGTRELTHDHADEQPFTRSLDGVEIPGEVATVTVEARDLIDGWSDEAREVDLPR